MFSITTRFPTKSLARLINHHWRLPCRSLYAAIETHTQKLKRIANKLLDLNKLEWYNYIVLTSLRMGLNNYGVALSKLGQLATLVGSITGLANETKAIEKTEFNIKIEKFNAAAKIKIIKEVRKFTNLGLNEAKDLVEKVHVMVKKGVTKEETNLIVAKLKELGAIVVLE